jgi:hypothetical protein
MGGGLGATSLGLYKKKYFNDSKEILHTW